LFQISADFARFCSSVWNFPRRLITVGGMVKQAMIFASIISATLVVGIFTYAALQQKKQFGRVKTQLEELHAAAQQSSNQAALLQQELTNSHSRIEALLKEKEQVTQKQQQMENQMRSALQSKDVTISELQGKLTVNILDRVLFASGEADLKPEGEQVLAQVASVLTQHTNRQIYVIGHTDNVPFRGSAFSRFSSNWELSTARATAAVRYLTEKAAVDPAKLAAVGYGEYHPIASNSTAEGRAKNRRIAIVIVPEHFNPLETPASTPTSRTNNPVSPEVPPEAANPEPLPSSDVPPR
jgi:chemotaxis protein MotB